MTAPTLSLPDLSRFDFLAPDARVWIYQSSRELEDASAALLRQMADSFTSQWASHGVALCAASDFLYNRFLVFMVDQQIAGASGCSIDSSVAFVRQLEQHFHTGFFDRWLFSWLDDDRVIAADKSVFIEKYRRGDITQDTLVFDHLVQTKLQLTAEWIKPLHSSWHKRFL